MLRLDMVKVARISSTIVRVKKAFLPSKPPYWWPREGEPIEAEVPIGAEVDWHMEEEEEEPIEAEVPIAAEVDCYVEVHCYVEEVEEEEPVVDPEYGGDIDEDFSSSSSLTPVPKTMPRRPTPPKTPTPPSSPTSPTSPTYWPNALDWIKDLFCNYGADIRS